MLIEKFFTVEKGWVVSLILVACTSAAWAGGIQIMDNDSGYIAAFGGFGRLLNGKGQREDADGRLYSYDCRYSKCTLEFIGHGRNANAEEDRKAKYPYCAETEVTITSTTQRGLVLEDAIQFRSTLDSFSVKQDAYKKLLAQIGQNQNKETIYEDSVSANESLQSVAKAEGDLRSYADTVNADRVKTRNYTTFGNDRLKLEGKVAQVNSPGAVKRAIEASAEVLSMSNLASLGEDYSVQEKCTKIYCPSRNCEYDDGKRHYQQGDGYYPFGIK